MTGFEGYHGNEEDVYVKGNKQKPSVYKNTVHETLPDPETENDRPGIDFDVWDKDSDTKIVEDTETGHTTDSYIAKSWHLDSTKTRAHEKQLVENALAGSGRKRIKTPEQVHQEKKLVEKLLLTINNDTKEGTDFDNVNNMTELEANTLNNIQNHSNDYREDPVRRESMSTATKRKLGRFDDGRGLKVKNQALDAERLLRDISKAPMLGRDNLKTMSDTKKQRTFGQRIKAFLLGENDKEQEMVSKNLVHEQMLHDIIDYDREN